jgi:hypothetical protein
MSEGKINPNVLMKLANTVNPVKTFSKRKFNTLDLLGGEMSSRDQTNSTIFWGGTYYVYI